MSPVLEVRDLRVRFGAMAAVRGIDLAIERGQTHCLVGESGCGKSVSALAVMRLLPRGAKLEAGAIRFAGEDIARLPERAMRRLRGDRMAMIFQEPMTSLNPAYTIGSQMTEVLRAHRGMGRAAAVERAEAMLTRVGVSAPGMRLGQYPHQLSGGLRQRVVIATALLCEPDLLVADEPTTALDVTVQVGILKLLADLKRDLGLAMLLITHDLGVVARIADVVSVMYAGEIVEHAPVAQVFAEPLHPYTRGLLRAIPVPGRVRRGEKLATIPGIVPRTEVGFRGCAFRDRCEFATHECAEPVAERVQGAHHWRCRLASGWLEAA